jgi:hypothetical protein
MKRSEMLEKMRELFKAYDGFLGCNYEYTIENILDFIEEAGMLPPPTIKEVPLKGVRMTSVGWEDLYAKEEVHEWEPEDEG